MKVRFRELTEAFHEDDKGEMTNEDFLREEWITMELKPTREELLSFESPFDWQFWEENALRALDRVFHAAGVHFQMWNLERYQFQALEECFTADGLQTALETISTAQSLDDVIREFDSKGITPLQGDTWDARTMKEFLQGVKDTNFFEDEADLNVVQKIDRLLAN